jgi:hypothetical protein
MHARRVLAVLFRKSIVHIHRYLSIIRRFICMHSEMRKQLHKRTNQGDIFIITCHLVAVHGLLYHVDSRYLHKQESNNYYSVEVLTSQAAKANGCRPGPSRC